MWREKKGFVDGKFYNHALYQLFLNFPLVYLLLYEAENLVLTVWMWVENFIKGAVCSLLSAPTIFLSFCRSFNAVRGWMGQKSIADCASWNNSHSSIAENVECCCSTFIRAACSHCMCVCCVMPEIMRLSFVCVFLIKCTHHNAAKLPSPVGVRWMWVFFKWKPK